MHSIASLAAFAGLAGLAVASPVERLQKRGAFRIDQVPAGTTRRVGAVALQQVFQKYSKSVPPHVAAAAAASGSVAANPEQYDSEYLCPVSVGGTTLNLDLDTGSADLYVSNHSRHAASIETNVAYSAGSFLTSFRLQIKLAIPSTRLLLPRRRLANHGRFLTVMVVAQVVMFMPTPLLLVSFCKPLKLNFIVLVYLHCHRPGHCYISGG